MTTSIAQIVDGLRGSGVLFAHEFDAPLLGIVLREHQYRVIELRLGPDEGLREAQALIATGLGLPDLAGHNLEALADTLADLATYWPDTERIVLLLHGVHDLVTADLPGWNTLSTILTRASERLAQLPSPARRSFETVALAHGHGVESIAEGAD